MNMNKLPRQNFSYGPPPEPTQMAPSPQAAQLDYLDIAPQTGGRDPFPGQMPGQIAQGPQGPPQMAGPDPMPGQMAQGPPQLQQGYTGASGADPVKGPGWQKPMQPRPPKTAMPVQPSPIQPYPPPVNPQPAPMQAGYGAAMQQKAPQPMVQKAQKQPQFGPSIRQDRGQKQPQANYLA